MNITAFKETMLNTLKYDSKFKDQKDKLLLVIRRATLNPIPKYDFTRISGQRYEDVEIRVPVPLIDEANLLDKDIYKLVKYVYEETEDYALGSVPIRPQILSSTTDEDFQHDVIFSEIQDTIVQGIRDAKFLIWTAVAWFSNDAIYRELLAKKEQGLNIRLIISDEESNNKLLAKLKSNFDVVVIPRHGWKEYNRMHDKFCIIDLDYVMHGSYNWTATANYNEETLATALDREFVKKFADEFMRMYVDNRTF